MLEFNKSQISKREVRKIRYFCGIVVQWRNPLRKRMGPTQCNKCTMFGHGSSNCHRKAACLGCGGPHDYSTCQLDKTQSNGPVIFKCYNCISKNRKNVNHRADDPHCPFRKEYLEIRHKVTYKHRPLRSRNRTILLDKSPETDYSENELFAISRKGIKTPTYDSKIQESKTSYASMAKSGILAEDNENISNDKIMDIYFEALDALQKCKNKYDKMRVLGMMLKHVI